MDMGPADSADPPNHEGPDPDAPVKQSRLATEAAPVARDVSGDPMASIRPELPELADNSPLLTPTVELTDLAARSLDAAADLTLERPLHGDQLGDQAQETHESGVFVIPVRESTDVGDDKLGGVSAPYVLRSRIGAGGMGEVWEARQTSLGRPVALKRLRDRRQTPRVVQRQFESEARLTGVLDHPNIVTVYELGHDQAGRVFYTMKLIEGTAWRELISSGRRCTGDGVVTRLELRDHLDILIEVCHAVAFAHSRGVIHRDIKPANVMIGDYGEVLLVDWGLAVALAPLPALDGVQPLTLESLPRAALVCGTPAYMSPETATANRERIGPATDVYLLGAVLFHVLYGRTPHRGKTVKQVITKAKANAWTYPSKIPGRLKPWDALLRPVINRALATDPEFRYQDAGEFGEALRRAIRNYDSAKVASRAQEQLDGLVVASPGLDRGDATGGGGYLSLSALIARLEGALESWPRNLAARQALGQANLELAKLALANGDFALTKISIDAYDQRPPLPDPEPERVSRRLTIHPADGTLVSAPRPTDSLVAAGTSSEWVSSAGIPRERSGSTGPHEKALARTIGAVGMAAERQIENAEGTHARLGRGLETLSSVASVQIQQVNNEHIRDDEEELAATAQGLREQLSARERGAHRRKLALWIAAGLAALLGITVLVTLVVGRAALERERDRTRAERDTLSKVLLDETANTVEARLEVQLGPVHGALLTATRWAQHGTLDVDDPLVLNRYFMPLLEGLDAASSTLRADADGNEYMLLNERTGWRTRSTSAGELPELHRWNRDGELIGAPTPGQAYDPHTRPWYQGGAALRSPSRQATSGAHPIFWTEPYRFFTTQELGISVSTPVTSAAGREFVLAFDVKLDDLSRITQRLPEGVEQGQVFVLDQQLRVLGLPREAAGLDPTELLLEPITELELLPISRAAVIEWRDRTQQTASDPFVLEHGADRYWASLRLLDRPDRPKMWIGVVVPESHFLGP
jgi:serine/threonine protein kinase